MPQQRVVLFDDGTPTCVRRLRAWAAERDYTVVRGVDRWFGAMTTALECDAHLLAVTAHTVPLSALRTALHRLACAGLCVITVDDDILAPDAAERYVATGSLRTPEAS